VALEGKKRCNECFYHQICQEQMPLLQILCAKYYYHRFRLVKANETLNRIWNLSCRRSQRDDDFGCLLEVSKMSQRVRA